MQPQEDKAGKQADQELGKKKAEKQENTEIEDIYNKPGQQSGRKQGKQGEKHKQK